jgi:hypothetical protein
MRAISLYKKLFDTVQLIKPQLGYLLLTGSCENYIRDTLAYILNRKYANVARDLRHRDNSGRLHIVDIAFMTGETISTCIELKQLYLKDMVNSGHKFYKNLEEDIKARQLLCKDVFGIVLSRRICSERFFGNKRITAYLYEDVKNRDEGILKLHDYLQIQRLRDVYPTKPDKALLAKWNVQGTLIELYGWIIAPSKQSISQVNKCRVRPTHQSTNLVM